ncbi:MAG: hypothetical protein H0V81_17660 [Solirubrobacterales bacterium]|nr:hypothetical protein [Solirubrobacterales bacterium]
MDEIPNFGGSDENVEEQPVVQENTEPVVDENLSLASPFLNKIPPQDRAVVARYIKEWDAGVTKKFQEYSGKLKPYESLGVPVEEIQKYVAFGNNFRTNPEGMFKVMWQALQEQYGDDFDANLARILELEEMMNEYEDDGYEQEQEVPDESQIFQQNVASELEEMRAWREERDQAELQAEEKQQLDSVFKTMHTKHGDFDEAWILTRLAEHGNPDQAFKEWNQMIGKHSQNGNRRQAPKVMGGQGGIPSGQIDTKSLRGKERKSVVAEMLSGLGDQ